ncbi:MAG: squalene/phytoene synthase family protein, partial [Pseudomonadota bacterium]|nr:squalene/phytoene synthase family protein [Pseudomonadota bacterium]
MQLDHIKNIVKKSGTTFYWGMRMLPKKKSNSMFVIYAFCRIVDDISDGKLDKMKKIQ